MKKAITLLLVILIAPRLAAQTFQGTATFSGRIVATDALSTAPIRVASSLPATCTVGQSVYLSTQPALEWLHVCTSTNTWTKQTVTSLAWGAITGKPTTFAPSTHTHLAPDLPATVLYSTGSYSNPAWLTSLGGAKISGAVPTATALAANGTNCPAGQAPLGVDASGNAEGCWTPSSGGGSVTSVGLAMPSQFTVTNSPITSSGTLTAAWNTQSANTVFAGPASGGAAAPTFRSLGTSDLPATVLYSTGSYSNPAWITALADTKLSGTIQVSGGNVGIGTAPAYNFDVAGNSAFRGSTLLFAQSQNNLSSANFRHLKRGNSASADGAVDDNAELGYFSFEGWDGSAYRRGALLMVTAAGAYTASSSPADLTLWTTPAGSTTAIERLKITSAGNVGVGKSNPATRLDVDGTVTATAFAGPLTGNVTGNASTATTLQTSRSIFGVSFDGSANIGSRSGNTTEFATVSGSKTTNKQLAFDANGNIIASATDIGAGGGGGGISLDDVPCVPGDLRWFCIVEEFPITSVTTGQIGTHGWSAGGTLAGRNADWPRVGILRLSTGTTSGNTTALGLSSSASFLDVIHDYTDDYVMEAKFVFKLVSSADMTFRVGIFESSGTAIDRGAALYAHNGGNFQISYTTNISTETRYDLGVASDTNWHTLRIRSDGVNARRFYFRLDNGTEVTLCESGCDINTTSAAMWPGAGIATMGYRPRFTLVTNTNAAKSVDIDYFSLKVNLGGTGDTR